MAIPSWIEGAFMRLIPEGASSYAPAVSGNSEPTIENVNTKQVQHSLIIQSLKRTCHFASHAALNFHWRVVSLTIQITLLGGGPYV